MKKVYLAKLYRFGYDLTTVGKTEKEAKETIMAEYVKTYKERNGCDPTDDETVWGNSYLEEAEESIEVSELTFGKVEWL